MTSNSLEQYANIPNELQALKQWVLWRRDPDGKGGFTKVPVQPNGKLASVTNSNTWTNFAQAVASAHTFDGIGFVFTAQDEFAGLDLDYSTDPVICERQKKIAEVFNSYSEISQSGQGLHIIIKAQVQGGRRRDKVELYSQDRFFCMTGNVWRNSPIEERQELATILWQEMGNCKEQTPTWQGDPNQKYSDEEIKSWAINAENGEKASKLLEGHWQDYYPSQSEADWAIINIIAYYSNCQAQVARIFRACALGQRKKAKRDNYVMPMVRRAFDRKLPPIDIEGLTNPFLKGEGK